MAFHAGQETFEVLRRQSQAGQRHDEGVSPVHVAPVALEEAAQHVTQHVRIGARLPCPRSSSASAISEAKSLSEECSAVRRSRIWTSPSSGIARWRNSGNNAVSSSWWCSGRSNCRQAATCAHSGGQTSSGRPSAIRSIASHICTCSAWRMKDHVERVAHKAQPLGGKWDLGRRIPGPVFIVGGKTPDNLDPDQLLGTAT